MSARIITNWKRTYTPCRVEITIESESQKSHVEERTRKRAKLYKRGERRRMERVRSRGDEVIEARDQEVGGGGVIGDAV